MHGEGVGGAVGLVVSVEVLLQPGEDVLLGQVGEHALVQVGAVSTQVTLAAKHGSILELQTIHRFSQSRRRLLIGSTNKTLMG